MSKKFRKKSIVIEAVQFTGDNAQEIANFIGVVQDFGDTLSIDTLEGRMTASVSDWIIKGVRGEFYPCKDEIFCETYEEVKEQQ